MLKGLMVWAITTKFWNRSFEYIMGILAFLAPLMSTYIILRLLSRRSYAWLFSIFNIFIVSLMPIVLSLYLSPSSFTDVMILMIIYSLIFVPATTYIMRSRRKLLNYQGKWTILHAYRMHWAIYTASFAFYFYSIFFIWTFAFNISSAGSNLLFYIFTGFLTFYYLILGFGIAKVGMEEKKRRKREMEKNNNLL
ncbi:MAG: hypothetical protein M1597_04425 [Candidatus Thermoplasmatota archaeon]|nr:hypothetical protein [Candidatus Thermoplasmatota archaeon]